MKNRFRQGFTLIELLAVIAIIGLLALLVVPNISSINNKTNEKISTQKQIYLESAAELFGSNNKDFFNDSDEKLVTVQELLEAEYISGDTKYGEGICTDDKIEELCGNESFAEDQCQDGKLKDGASIKTYGCVTDNNGNILNASSILLTKKINGIVATLNGTTTDSDAGSLVIKVCEGFGEKYYGKRLSNSSQYCGCKYNAETKEYEDKLVIYDKTEDNYKSTETEISGENDACIIVSNKDNGEVDNWLKYNSDKPNWRVIGLYNVKETGGDTVLSAKMITSDPID